MPGESSIACVVSSSTNNTGSIQTVGSVINFITDSRVESLTLGMRIGVDLETTLEQTTADKISPIDAITTLILEDWVLA